MKSVRFIVVLLVVVLLFISGKCLRGSVDIRPEDSCAVYLYQRENVVDTRRAVLPVRNMLLQSQFIERRYSELQGGILCLGVAVSAL